MKREVLLDIRGIDKAFPGVRALKSASLKVYAGSAMTLIGEKARASPR